MLTRSTVFDPGLRAVIVDRRPLLYAEGPSADEDRPPNVRAASGLAWLGDELAVVQDDANFLALIAPATGLTRAIPLERGPGGLRQFDDARGNKAHKLDLEAIVTI